MITSLKTLHHPSPLSNERSSPICSNYLSFLHHQPSQTKIVHHILNVLHAVLDSVAAFPQSVVLEVENLETSVDVFDELTDLQRTPVVAQCD